MRVLDTGEVALTAKEVNYIIVWFNYSLTNGYTYQTLKEADFAISLANSSMFQQEQANGST